MQQQKQLFGHPVGLYVLFMTELWERFSYYGMRAILVLFMVTSSTKNPGFGWTESKALEVYGTYTFLVYFFNVPGGIIADKWLGQKRAAMLGGILLVAGHSILALASVWAFYTGLAFIIMGVGCLKANVSTMVGELYAKGDARRDKGFSIFYIGINIGGFIAPLMVGYVGEVYGWHYGFGLAGIGMTFGLIIFALGQKYLKGIGNTAQNATPEKIAARNTSLSKTDKDRMIVIAVTCLLIVLFWSAYEQAGGLMNLYAEQKTNRRLAFTNWTVPASWFQSVTSFFIILLAAPIAAFWYWWKRKGREASAIFKMALGIMIMGWGFLFMVAAAYQYKADGSSAMYWLVLAYFLHTVGELCASPVALSFITKLAPARYCSSMMGIYFAATGLGNYVAGWLGIWSRSAGELQLFAGIAVACTLAGILVIAFLPAFKRLCHGAENDLTTDSTPADATLQIQITKPAPF
ncbi:peptide MFS transporter [Mucilaginibacter sp. Bleaf8]|uniref:peptide MFS transporter n=1 Tax=Mucilaginibacter sp. Bleaf8 TaxID=2834430 RepID=UPI001BD182AE|nr:peptide MFS transporter [Mucilaginibacter sp. Bleaf8]MBS7566769.1 peptide MFS transporter [Mucilaginibacter sp. Bleaf8]